MLLIKNFVKSKMTIYKIKLLLLFTLISSVCHANDLIEFRKNAFKLNKEILGSISKNVLEKDFQAIKEGAVIIADWANIMLDYFPESSKNEATKDEIWINGSISEKFKRFANENKKVAYTLIDAAETEDNSFILTRVRALGDTCQTCHKAFRN